MKKILFAALAALASQVAHRMKKLKLRHKKRKLISEA